MSARRSPNGRASSAATAAPVLIGGAVHAACAAPGTSPRRSATRSTDKTGDLAALMRRKSAREIAACAQACATLGAAHRRRWREPSARRRRDRRRSRRRARRAPARRAGRAHPVQPRRRTHACGRSTPRSSAWSIRCRSMSRSGSSAIGRKDSPCWRPRPLPRARCGAVLRSVLALGCRPAGHAARRRAPSPRRSDPVRPHPVARTIVGNAIGLALEEPPLITAESEERFEPGGVYSLRAGACDEQAASRHRVGDGRWCRRRRKRAAMASRGSHAMTALERLGQHVASGAPVPDARELVELHLIDTRRRLDRQRAARPKAGCCCDFAPSRARAKRGGGSLALDLATRCALARLSEIDDIHLASMTTPGSIVIPGALTLAARDAGREGRRRDRRDPRRLRGDDPARPRHRRADRPLSRHLADLFRRALRHRRGRGAAARARRAADRAMRWRWRSPSRRPASAITTRRPRRAGSRSATPPATGSPPRWRRKPASPPTSG